MDRTVQESITIAAPPAQVYAAVSDVAGIGRFSPEASGATLRGDRSASPAAGTRFIGHNRGRAAWQRWSTQCTVTVAEPGRAFGFDVHFLGLPISAWRYDLEPVGPGRAATLVTETWVDRRSGLPGSVMVNGGALLTGVRDRAAHNRAGMRQTLERLKAALESAAAEPPA